MTAKFSSSKLITFLSFILFVVACLFVSYLFWFFNQNLSQDFAQYAHQEKKLNFKYLSLYQLTHGKTSIFEHIENTESTTSPSTQASETTKETQAEEHTTLQNLPILLENSQKSIVTLEQIKAFLKAKSAHERFLENADLFWQTSLEIGVEPAVTFAQIALETNFMHYTGTVIPEYHNTSGLKRTDVSEDESLEAHAQFSSWAEGVKAQVEHLALYAGKEGYPLAKDQATDTRHFPYLYKTAPDVLALGKKWAPSAAYGERLMDLINEMLRH